MPRSTLQAIGERPAPDVPEAEIVIVEPEGWDDMAQSLDLGEIVPVGADAPNTFCDAIMTPRVSPTTFGILRRRNAQAASVRERRMPVLRSSTHATRNRAARLWRPQYR